MKSTEQLKVFRDMGEVEMKEKYSELMLELFMLRSQEATAQLSSPARFKQVRKEIARLRTVAIEKDIEI
ncbi:MAG TPA: 50S ribosomal protein L29 [bacterium]|jgi:large subunit ribosomal protein L29